MQLCPYIQIHTSKVVLKYLSAGSCRDSEVRILNPEYTVQQGASIQRHLTLFFQHLLVALQIILEV
jgi:hypothetical protein